MLLLALMVLAPAAVEAQTGRIVGTVTDATSGAPLAEVQVFIPALSQGGLSNQSGRFILLNVPAGTHELRAERIGLAPATQQVTVTEGGAAEVEFTLSTQALGLDEIVVTGTAGAARRREVGNTINQINVAELPERSADVTDMLTASAPGVQVTVGGGGAGQGSKIRLRGSNSLEMGSDPIIYIDGVRMMSGGFENRAAKDQGNRAANVTQSPLDMLNPNDIERIEIIKGSAATTLYGTEASAGVIQVFTKKGSSGSPVWTFETQQGTSWLQRFGYGDDPSSRIVDGALVPFAGGGTSKYLYMEPWICTGPFDCGQFQDTPWLQSYSASVRGGGENLQYFSSGEFLDEHGATPNDYLDRYSARGNFTYSPVSTLQLQWNTAYSHQGQTNSPQGNNAEGLELNVFRQNENYHRTGDPAVINKVMEQTLSGKIERFTTGATATYSPITDLTNRFTIGYDFSNQETRNIRPFGFYAHPEGIIYVGNFQKRMLTFDYVGSYQFNVLENIRSNFSWGGQAVGDEERLVEGYGRDFPGAAEPTVNSAAITQGYEERQKVWNAGFFLQNIFDVSNRYFLTLGMRVDGNSAFGAGFGLQMYPKASLAWVTSDESFWNPSWGQVKLRAAYGKSGRAPGAFDATRTWEGTPLAGEPAFIPENVGNADLGPEVTTEWEAGFDASWLDDRLRGTLTYYHQLTDDALMDVNQIPSLGFTQEQLTNVGEIENTGLEVGVDVSAIARADWGLDLGVNFSTNNSEVLSHVEPINVGRSIAWSNHTIIHNQDVIVENTTAAAVPPCTDAILAEGRPCRENNVYLGPNLPTKIISGHISARLPYGIMLSTRGEFRGGMFAEISPIAIGRSVRSPICEPYYANQENVRLKSDIPAIWVARCTPSLADGYSIAADYFKMRTLTLTAPMDFVFPDRVQNATLTLSLNNFYTWSKESFWGTYAFENFGNDGITDEGDSSGISDNERIPAPTTLRASVRVTF